MSHFFLLVYFLDFGASYLSFCRNLIETCFLFSFMLLLVVGFLLLLV